MKDLVLGQAKINESLTKKLTTNDKMLKNINSQIESLSSAVKNQLSFNKMIKTQISQIAVAIPGNQSGKIPGLPENSLEINEGGEILSDRPKTSNHCRR